MVSMVRLFCFVALFAMLCVKGGELCSAGPHFLSEVFGNGSEKDKLDPGPLRSHGEAFRGVSPLPGVTGRMLSSLRSEKRE